MSVCSVQCIACMFNMKPSLIVQCVGKIHSFHLKHVFFVRNFIYFDVSRAEQWLKIQIAAISFQN